MTETPPLPELSPQRRDALEQRIIADVGRSRGRRARRRGWLIAGAGVAGVLAVVLVLPGVVGAGSGGADSAVSSGALIDDGANETSGVQIDGVVPDAATGGADDAGTSSVADAERAVISSATVSVTVEDVADAAADASRIAGDAGGYVENLTIGASGQMPVEPLALESTATTPTGGWVALRVPASALDEVVAGLGTLGELTASSVSRSDVTDQRVDLEARIEASEVSVARLQQLMAQAGSVGDLLDAEAQLSERQATLESYRQQLEMLDGQVAMASVSVQLSAAQAPETADPAGFLDGVEYGWGGLIATVNAAVIAIGFLLPWLAVAAVALLGVWLLRRVRRHRRVQQLRSQQLTPDEAHE